MAGKTSWIISSTSKPFFRLCVLNGVWLSAITSFFLYESTLAIVIVHAQNLSHGSMQCIIISIICPKFILAKRNIYLHDLVVILVFRNTVSIFDGEKWIQNVEMQIDFAILSKRWNNKITQKVLSFHSFNFIRLDDIFAYVTKLTIFSYNIRWKKIKIRFDLRCPVIWKYVCEMPVRFFTLLSFVYTHSRKCDTIRSTDSISWMLQTINSTTDVRNPIHMQIFELEWSTRLDFVRTHISMQLMNITDSLPIRSIFAYALYFESQSFVLLFVGLHQAADCLSRRCVFCACVMRACMWAYEIRKFVSKTTGI